MSLRGLHHGIWAILLVAIVTTDRIEAEIVQLEAKDTLTVLEMDLDDQLRFRLRDGRIVTLVLEDTDAAIVEKVDPGGIVYRFSAALRIDGEPIRLERYVCSQECFYEPWVVNGLRIWLDTVRDVFDLIPVRYPRKGNSQCVPRKAARLAVQDATLRICPDKVLPWIEHDSPALDVGQCYNGDDCYLGPYLGKACHVGMDINHAKGSMLFAPIKFDTQAYFNSLAAGDNNNRWRGIRRWQNGDVWALQSHHLVELRVTPNTAIEAGTTYATTAGVHVGSHQHTHFEFKIGQSRNAVAVDAESIASPIDFDDQSELAQQHPEVLHLDPWIVFWQSFEDRRERQGKIRAAMRPLEPVRVGENVRFTAAGSRPGNGGKNLRYFWTFGNSSSATGPMPSHVFSRAGVIPVRLIVDDGVDRDSVLQWLTVSGNPAHQSELTFSTSDDTSFCPWPTAAPELYAQPLQIQPNTIHFLVRPGTPSRSKSIFLVDLKGKVIPSDLPRIQVDSRSNADWLSVEQKIDDERRWLSVNVNAAGLQAGTYHSSFRASYPSAFFQGSTHPALAQHVTVELLVSNETPPSNVVVDDADPGFYATPYFWVGHRFCRCPNNQRGYGGFYLTNGCRCQAGQFARFTPNLQAGEYDVSLSDQTPFSTGVAFNVRVRHAGGEEIVRVQPEKSLAIGSFRFNDGTGGFVDVLAEGSQGLVIVDAVHFRKKTGDTSNESNTADSERLP